MLLFILSCGCPLGRICGCLCHRNVSFFWGDKVVESLYIVVFPPLWWGRSVVELVDGWMNFSVCECM